MEEKFVTAAAAIAAALLLLLAMLVVRAEKDEFDVVLASWRQESWRY